MQLFSFAVFQYMATLFPLASRQQIMNTLLLVQRRAVGCSYGEPGEADLVTAVQR